MFVRLLSIAVKFQSNYVHRNVLIANKQIFSYICCIEVYWRLLTYKIGHNKYYFFTKQPFFTRHGIKNFL